MRFRPTDSLELIAQGAYVDAKDNQYEIGSGLINAPKLSGSLWAGYRFMGDKKIAGINLGDVRLSGSVNYVGERQGELTLQDKDKSEHYTLPAYTTVDLGVNYLVSDHIDVDLATKNIFNQYYIQSASGDDENHVGKPRNYMLSVNFKY